MRQFSIFAATALAAALACSGPALARGGGVGGHGGGGGGGHGGFGGGGFHGGGFAAGGFHGGGVGGMRNFGNTGFQGRSVAGFNNRGFSNRFNRNAFFGGFGGGGWDGYDDFADYPYEGYGDPSYAYDYGYPNSAYPGYQYGNSVTPAQPLQTGRSVATGDLGNYCTTPVKTCELFHAANIGAGCSCKVSGGRANGLVAP
ncbi:MAG: hypothetical protein WDN46_12525 [Methylocella sp.]